MTEPLTSSSQTQSASTSTPLVGSQQENLTGSQETSKQSSFKEEAEAWDSEQPYWDKFWDHYAQCEESKAGQRIAAMSPAERAEYKRKTEAALAEAAEYRRQHDQGNVAAD